MSFQLWFFCGFVLALVGESQPNISAAEWQGYQKSEFLVGRRLAFLIEPKEPATGKPWIWRTEFFGHEPQTDLELLKRGFHVAYIDLQNLYGAPVAMEPMDALYAEVTKTYGLAPRVVLEGFSRGGLFALNWAAKNPEKIACIYNDAPVCDFKSWPAGKGTGVGSPADWERLKGVYGFKNDAEAEAYRLNPVDNLAPLAAAKIPLLHVCGETDDVVPLAENSTLVAQRYKELGGAITLIVKPHCNHHPHSLKDPTRIVNFVLSHTGFVDQVKSAPTPYGADYYKLRGGLENARQKFLRDKVGRVAFLGGSITAAPGWRDQVCADLKRRFPETQFDFINAGISSLGSTPGAFRFRRDVLANGPVDLLFEEAAVNDDTNEFSDVEQVRGMEGIVRQAKIANPHMDIVLLHFVDPGKIQQYNQGKTPSVITNHEKVAERYLLPSIDLAKEVTERIHAGEMTWERDFRDLHPSPFGHELYARSVGRLFDAAWNAEAAKSIQPRQPELSAPLDPFSYFRGQLVSPQIALGSGDLKLKSGWSVIENWQPTDGAGTREGFVKVPTLVAVEPGADLTFEFTGTAVGVFVASGPDTGNLDYRIDQGAWQTQELFTKWSSGLHLPWAKMLASELSEGRHRLDLKNSATMDQRSKGHAIRIVYLLVN
ncbi:SGNH/GDSL hydrolase family protein [Schlesneria paludicola]|uniref:SGNH/GDSL hydrolase family protein n=1 Tax=Schlesneria paludicola TaxID=360056 RepID=UPI00138AB58D|nr:GDSL-type esterase/lipase family protein [Schlesneria paludicola]